MAWATERTLWVAKAGRTTSQGVVGSYIHLGGKVCVLVEVNCESDFVARTEPFQVLVKELAMHIAAADPKWVRREDVPAEALEKEKDIYRAQFANSGKPANVIEKIIEGKLGSFYAQTVLLDQPSVRDDKVTVQQLIAETSAPARTHRPPAKGGPGVLVAGPGHLSHQIHRIRAAQQLA